MQAEEQIEALEERITELENEIGTLKQKIATLINGLTMAAANAASVA